MTPFLSWLTILIVIPAGVGILWGFSTILNITLDHIAGLEREDDNAMRRGGRS